MSHTRRTSLKADPGSRMQLVKLSRDIGSSSPFRKSGTDVRLGTTRSRRAIKNPNWRFRSSESCSGEGTEDVRDGMGEQGATISLGHWQRPTKVRSTRVAQHLGKENSAQGISTEAGESSTSSADLVSRTQSRGISPRRRNNTPEGFTHASRGPVIVKRQVQITDLTRLRNEQSLSLIELELIPGDHDERHSSTDRLLTNGSSLAEIVRLPGSFTIPERWIDAYEDDGSAPRNTDQPTAKFDGTPQLVRSLALPSHANDARSHDTPRISVQWKPANKNASDTRAAAPAPYMQKAPKKSPRIEDINYHKILQKLNDGTRSDPRPSNTTWQPERSEGRNALTSHDTQIHRKLPTLNEDRRGGSWDRSGDSGYASLPANGSEQQHVSEIITETKPTSKTGRSHFNPRARDFLSLAGTPVVASETLDGSTDASHFPSQEHAGISSAQTLPTSVSPLIGHQWPSMPTLAPLYGGFGFPRSIAQAYPFIGGHLASKEEPTTQLLMANPGASLPVAPCNTPLVGTSSLFQPLFSVMPVPYPVPCHHQVPKPTTINANPGLHPMPVPPRPVPKPRAPNAIEQLRYEAYVEQCKATMPGYAMECKMRQQTRAQRKLEKSRIVNTAATGLDPKQTQSH